MLRLSVVIMRAVKVARRLRSVIGTYRKHESVSRHVSSFSRRASLAGISRAIKKLDRSYTTSRRKMQPFVRSSSCPSSAARCKRRYKAPRPTCKFPFDTATIFYSNSPAANRSRSLARASKIETRGAARHAVREDKKERAILQIYARR